MPHQNTTSSKATAQNAATDPVETSDQPAEGADAREPRSYAAPELGDATLASPAAGEVADYMDEGEALDVDDVQQGGTNANRPYRTEKAVSQGAKTHAANQERLKGEG